VASIAYHVLAERYDGASLGVYRNGALMATSSFATSGPWILAQVGAWYSTYFLQGELAEVILYASALSSTDLANVTSYLRTKYAL
jgi:hypothetical protein